MNQFCKQLIRNQKSLAIGDHKPIPLATKRIDAEQYEVNDPYSGDKTKWK